MMNPKTTPSGDAKIKNVSQTDFYFSLAKASAHTGIKIHTKTQQKPIPNLSPKSITKLDDRPKTYIAIAFEARDKTRAGLIRLDF